MATKQDVAFCSVAGFGWLESVAAPVDRDNLGVMEQAVEYRAGGGYIAEQFAPFFDGSVRSHHGGAVFVARMMIRQSSSR